MSSRTPSRFQTRHFPRSQNDKLLRLFIMIQTIEFSTEMTNVFSFHFVYKKIKTQKSPRKEYPRTIHSLLLQSLDDPLGVFGSLIPSNSIFVHESCSVSYTPPHPTSTCGTPHYVFTPSPSWKETMSSWTAS